MAFMEAFQPFYSFCAANTAETVSPGSCTVAELPKCTTVANKYNVTVNAVTDPMASSSEDIGMW